MAVELNHTIIPSRDKSASAEFLAELLEDLLQDLAVELLL